jgi:hypothetical protein
MLLTPASTMILTALLAAAPGAATVNPQERAAPPGPATLTACTLLTADEIEAALGRADLATPRRAITLPNGGTDCRFFGQGLGDVRVLLDPPNANEDFALRGKILKEEGAKYQPVEGLGSGAYYWDDRLQVFVGKRTFTLWVNRTDKTESAGKVREALIGLAKKAIEKLRR